MTTFVDAAVLASVLLALAVAPRVLARGQDTIRATGRSVSPLAALVAVTGLIYLNQVLCTVYILRMHGGDPSFIARYLPGGWFDLADGNSGLRWLAGHWPAPSLLAPTILRVQAFLELPFVLLAFATVLRWLDPSLYRRIVRSPLLPLAAVSYTAVFCAVEWDLYNPYTLDDIVIRVVSAVVTPALMVTMAARDRAEPRRPHSAASLLLFIASVGALGVVVLVVYDTALLYNLGRLDDRAPLAVPVTVALIVFRAAAALTPPRPSAGAAVAFMEHGLRRWLTFFFVPALAIRYGVTFGTPVLAAGAGLLLAAAAGTYALRDALAQADQERRGPKLLLLLGQLGCALLVATTAAYAAARWATDSYYEAVLLQATAVFLVTVVAVCALTDAAVCRVRAARARST